MQRRHPYRAALLLLLEDRWGRSVGGHGGTLGRLVVATGRGRPWSRGISVAVGRGGASFSSCHVGHFCIWACTGVNIIHWHTLRL